jgi:hypothetical protein
MTLLRKVQSFEVYHKVNLSTNMLPLFLLPNYKAIAALITPVYEKMVVENTMYCPSCLHAYCGLVME